MTATGGNVEMGKQIEYLARALKAPRIREAAARLGDQAREAGWTHEEYLAAVLDREVSARNTSGAELRVRAAERYWPSFRRASTLAMG
jgi:hypothetical protein